MGANICKKTLSIIIPYYKETEKELFFPLASVRGQVGVNFENIECLLVNDGSGQTLPESFLALFETLNPRCIYLAQNNGPGVARQAGLDDARGEYVMFLDADDILYHVWALRAFFEAFDKSLPDLIYTPVMMEYYKPASPLNGEYIYALKNDTVQMLHGKVYNRAYLQKNNIRFHKSLRWYEDIYFNELAFAGGAATQKIPDASYLRRYRADSITRSDSYSYFIETMTENIKSAGYLCDEFEARYPGKLPALLAHKVAYFYFVMHWPQWQGEDEQFMLKNAEEALREMLAPRMRWFEQVPEADFAQIYNRQRDKYFTWNGEIEPFKDWLNKFASPSNRTDVIYRHMVARFGLMDAANQRKMEEYFYVNKFWGSFNPARGDYGVFRNRAQALTGHAEDFLWLYNRVADRRSRFVLQAVIENWLDLNCARLAEAIDKTTVSYFDPAIMRCDENEVLVDLGACTGDTVANYLNTYGLRYKKIYCYEITPDVFADMKQTLLGKYHFENIELRQKGAGEKRGQMFLKENAFTFSGNALAADGEIAVDVVSMDEDIPEPVTFIKMDIEGAEQAAIRGCAGHIANDKPKLAIALYHNNEDIWKIPRMIDEICPGYKFYLRYHGGDLVPTELELLAVR